MRKLSSLSKSSKIVPVDSESGQPVVQNDEVTDGQDSGVSSLPEPLDAAATDFSSRPGSRIGKRFIRYENSWIGGLSRGNTIVGRPKSSLEAHGEDGTTDCANDGRLFLINYFAKLSQTESEEIDLDKIERLIAQGACVNAVLESTGESIFHNIASNWDADVAEFMLDKGANIHVKDKRGRTPLHVAASSDHKEMVLWLLEHGAEIEAQTYNEKQTPTFAAASNDAINALQVLVEWKGDYEARDYMGRTPLHLAAELDRTLSADFLLSLEIPAECRVVDKFDNHAITSMIRTMPKTALRALDQLHRVAPADRQQYFLLAHLEPEPGSKQDYGIKSPFETAVEEESHEILSHPVMQELIQQKWKKAVRWYFFSNLALYFIFLLSWSVLIAYPSVQEKHKYVFPRDIWRIILEVVAVGLYIKQIVDEILDFIRSKIKHKCYTKARSNILLEDLKNTDHSVPEERKYLESELRKTNKSPSNYFKDPWNIIDIITYITLIVFIVLHTVDIWVHREQLALWTARISCGAAVLIWVRLLNHARGFRVLGPLVAIIGQLIGDILRYFALYAVFFIPYVICFWVLFGGDQSNGVEDGEDLINFYRVVIMMFRMSLIDDYPYMTLRTIDELMSAILVITFLLFTAVVGLNLFIALLSDTFQRVYDNAQANAILQQARIIQSYEESMCSCTYQRYLVHIHDNCNPRALYYDDDDTHNDQSTQLQKITHQTYNIVSELKSSIQEEENSKVSELAGLSGTLAERMEQQEEKMLLISQHLVEIKTVLFALQQQTGKLTVRASPTLEENHDNIPQTSSSLISVQGDGARMREIQQSSPRDASPLIHSHRYHKTSDASTCQRNSTKPLNLPPLKLKSVTDLPYHGYLGHNSITTSKGAQLDHGTVTL